MAAGRAVRVARRNPLLFAVGSILEHENNLRKMSSVMYRGMADELRQISLG